MASPSALPASFFSGHLRDRLWRGDQLAASAATVPSGFRILDEQLPGGGWPTHGLIELLLPAPGIGEIRLLAPTLKQLADRGRPIVLLGPPYRPLLRGWSKLGIASSRILLIETGQAADWSWAVEQTLKSGAFGALIAWQPVASRDARSGLRSGPGPEPRSGFRFDVRHEALRRMQLAATAAGGLSFLLRPIEARLDASPAPLRLSIEAGEGRNDSLAPRNSLSVRVLKRRGSVLARPLIVELQEIRPLRPRRTRVPAVSPEALASAQAPSPDTTREVDSSAPTAPSGHALDRPLVPRLAA